MRGGARLRQLALTLRVSPTPVTALMPNDNLRDSPSSEGGEATSHAPEPAEAPMHRKRDSHGEGRPAAATAAIKLFVLDTNVLMHDPTSLFRFEEHDVYLPMVTLEELDDNKKGMSEVARNARQASRFLDEIVSSGAGDIESGYCAQGQDARRRARAPLPADSRRHRRDPGLGRLAEGRQRDPRRGHAPEAAPPQAPGRAGVQGHQHAHQGACDRARRRGLLQRQGARGHRPPLHRHAGAARGLLGQPRQGRRELAGARPHALPREGAPVSRRSS